jgi:hypothetical protein
LQKLGASFFYLAELATSEFHWTCNTPDVPSRRL